MHESRRRRQLLRGLWLLAILMVVTGSLLPSATRPMQALGELQINDKLEHLGAYLVLAFLPALHERRNVVAAAALGAVALGIGLEFAQLYSPGRSFEIADMAADAGGVCVGLASGIALRFAIVRRFGM